MIKYQGQIIPVFSIPPNWADDFTFTERYGGLVFEALSTVEERLATQPRPLISVAFNTLTLSEQETGYIRKILESDSVLPIALPLWNFKRLLTASPVIGNTFVKCDPICAAMFDVCPNSILWNSYNYFETFRTFAVGASEVQFGQPMTKQFGAGDYVVPLIVGHFARDSVPAVTDIHSKFPVKFDEQFFSECFATPQQISGTRVYRQPAFEYCLTGGDIL